MRVAGAIFIFSTGLIAFIQPAHTADIYKWTDEQGHIHFGDRPPAKSNPEKVEVKINSYESVDVIYSPDWFYHTEDNNSAKHSVVMYSTQWCKYCKKARRYFKDNNIAFTEYDVEKSEKGKQDYKRLGAKGVPIIMIGERRMNGFSIKKFKSIYNKQ